MNELLKEKYDVHKSSDFQTYLETIQDLLNEPELSFKTKELTPKQLDEMMFDLELAFENGWTPYFTISNIYNKTSNLGCPQ